MKQFVTPHQHQDSLDSASTPEMFLQREVELGGIALTVTDHGSMASCRKVYELAKKNNLIPILGCELYMRDDDCDILKRFGIDKDENGTTAYYNKYYHLTAHAQNQEAYEAMVRILSIADGRAERHGSERKPLLTWENIEELGSYDVTFTSSCLVGVVQRHLLSEHSDKGKIAMAYYDRIRSMVKPGNFYVEVFPHRCSHNWDNAVYVTLENGEKLRYYPKKKLATDKGEFEAAALARAFTGRNPPTTLQGVMHYRKWHDLEPSKIIKVDAVEGFIQNECTPLSPGGDIQFGANKFVLALANKFGDKALISDDSHFAYPEDKVVQDMKLNSTGGNGWRFYESYHRYSSKEALEYFKTVLHIDQKTVEGWIDNSHEFASKFKDFTFVDRVSLPSKFYPSNTLAHLKSLIDKHGRMLWDDKRYVDRLKTEIDLFKNNGKMDLLPYFFLAEELVSYCSDNGLITGEGRGSAAGVLISFLLGIVHKDPIKHNLSLERFLTLDRIQSGSLPDIDMDFPDRDLLIDPENGFLAKRFGDHYAQISTDTLLRLKSTMKDVCRAKRGYVLPEIEAYTKRIPDPPQGVQDIDFINGYVSEDGKETKGLIDTNPAFQEYIEKFPEDWEIVKRALGITRQKSRHASAFVIANEPIHNFIPLTTISDVRCTQYTMDWVEKVGGIKIDLLGLNTLNDISAAMDLVREKQIKEIEKEMKTELLERKKELERQLALLKDKKAKEYIPGRGYVPHQRLLRVDGKLVDIFELPEDQEVFNTIAEGKTETVFQFSTPSARMWLKEFDYEKEPGKKAFTSIKDLSAFTALDRPGPLDAKVGGENGHNMLVEFANRAKGLPATDPIPVLDELLPETYGVIVFQESLQQVYQYLTGCTGSEAETFRRYIARKKMDKVDAAYPNFIEQASKKVGKEAAERIWDQIKTFGQYGFNMSHSLCYSDTGYVCAFLKYHHFLEWWAGVLKNANKNEIASTFWGFIKDHVDMPDITVSKEDWTVVDGRLRAPLGFLAGVGEKAGVELEKGRPYKDIADFVAKIEKTKDENSYFDEKRGRRVRGRSALHRGIVCKLIVAGAMDSLFPEGLSDIEKIDMYLEESANARKIKKEAVPKEYLDLDPLTRYQFRKSILPIYSESLVDAVYSVGGIEMNKEVKEDGSTVYSGTDPRGNVFRFVNGRHLRLLEKAPITVDVAVAAYVLDERQFSYGADKSKKAVSYSFDIDGEVFEFVAWADRKGNIKTPVNTKGSIVVVALNKWNKDRPFAIKEVVVVRSSS